MPRNASSYIIMLINFHLILIIILCTVQFSHCFPTQTSTYSNLKRISELQSIQRFQLANPLFSWNAAISQYNECISKLQESRETRNGISNIFGPFFLYKIEGVPLKLSCSPCVPSGFTVSWTRLSFENIQQELQRSDADNSTTLIIDSPTGDLSTYYCSWLFNKTEILDFMWTPEIVPSSNLQKVPYRNWTRHGSISLEGIKITTQVDEWSPCSKCGIVGKRHRIAYCTAKAASNPIESPNSAPIWQAFDVYSSVSCNLFLNLHPEIGSLNQKASQLLAKRPQVLVGYCKRPCTHYDTRFDAWQKDLVNSTHPILHHIYARPFDEFWEYETEDNDGSDNSNYINKRLTISEMSQIVINFKDIPLSKEYLPEIISFSALLTLQLIICIQIFRNRRAAK